MIRRAPAHLLVAPESIARLLAAAMLGSLLMLADGYLLVLASRSVGLYLLLAAEASTGLFAAVYAYGACRTQARELRLAVGRGAYPLRQFRRMLALVLGAALLIVPGFATDAVGLLLLLRPTGWPAGALLERLLRESLIETCEYLRLER